MKFRGNKREDELGFLVFPNIDACRKLCGSAVTSDTSELDLLSQFAVRAHVARGLAALQAAGRGSSTYATRALLLAEPPSVDTGEITDKGYINQRAVLTRRASLVEGLYRNPPDDDVILLHKMPRGTAGGGEVQKG